MGVWLVLGAGFSLAQDSTQLVLAAGCGDVLENIFDGFDSFDGGHYYEIRLDAGDKLSVLVEAVNRFPDIEIFLLDASFNVVVQSESAGPQEEIVGFPIEVSGLYTLNLFAFRDGIGPYVLSIACERADGTMIPAGDYIPGGEMVDRPPSATPVSVIVPLTLFMDENSLTLYVPQADVPVALADLAFQVQVGMNTVTRRLADYAGFVGLPFDRLPVPICFRLVRAGTSSPLLLECQSIRLVLVQPLAGADVFWFDPLAAGARLVTVYQGAEFVGLCQSLEAGCPIEVVLRAVTATATPSPTDAPTPEVSTPTAAATEVVHAYPCAGVVVANATMINVVRDAPSTSGRLVGSVQVDSTLMLYEKAGDSDNWYRIHENRFVPRWIPAQYIQPSETCPQ